ncbi:MAG: oligosaccharide flippase family protein [Clostridia bacterium]|nr:oligosaccharide flippase family protein [Clostridia bacterium]
MDDKKVVSVGKDSVKLTASKFITLAIAMVSAMLLSRFRSKFEYGTYSQLLLVINLFTSIFMLGLPNSVNYFLARAEDQAQRRKFLSVYYTLSTVLSAVLGLVLVLSVPLIEGYFKNDTIRHFSYFLAIFPWSKIIAQSIENVLVVYKKTNMIMVYRIANSASLLGIIFLAKFAGWSFSGYMLSYVVVEVIFALIVYVTVIKLAGGIDFSLDLKFVVKIFKFSIPIGLASVMGTLTIEFDKLFIGRVLDTETLAIYTNASKEMPFHIITTSVTAVVMPAIVRLLKQNKTDDVVKLWHQMSEIVFIPLCFLSCMFIAYAEQVMCILYDFKYLSGAPVFRIYCLLIMIRFTYFGMILNSSGKTRFVLYSSMVTLGLNIVFNFLFYYLFDMFGYGIIGPAIATVLCVVVMSISQLTFSSRILKIKFSKIMPWKKFGKILLICSAFGVAAFLALRAIAYAIPHEAFYDEQHVMTTAFIAIGIGVVFTVIYFAIFFKRIKNIWQQIK